LSDKLFTVDTSRALKFLTTTLIMPASVAQAKIQDVPEFFFAVEVDIPFFGTEGEDALMSSFL
jgi:hypothetical protein